MLVQRVQAVTMESLESCTVVDVKVGRCYQLMNETVSISKHHLAVEMQ